MTFREFYEINKEVLTTKSPIEAYRFVFKAGKKEKENEHARIVLDTILFKGKSITPGYPGEN